MAELLGGILNPDLPNVKIHTQPMYALHSISVIILESILLG